MHWGSATLLRRVQLLAALLCASPSIARTQEQHVREADRHWLGCWSIQVQDSVPELARNLLIRLDSTPTYRGPPPHYYGMGLEGFRAPGKSPSWLSWGAPSGDSLMVTIIGLGGYGWRFHRSADSLAGLTYLYYDVIPDETVVGRASARRRACP